MRLPLPPPACRSHCSSTRCGPSTADVSWIDRAIRRLPLPPAGRAAKCRAIDAYTSQLEPSPDGRPVVPAELVHRLRTDDEVLLAGRRAA